MQNFKELAAALINRRNIEKIERQVIDRYDEAANIFKACGDNLTNDRFVLDDNNKRVYNNTLKWLLGLPFEAINPETKQWQSGSLTKGLYIAGPVGTGKSMLMRLLAIISNYYSIKVTIGNEKKDLIWADERVDDITNAIITNGAASLNDYRNKPILNINDFGSGTVEQVYMGNRINALRLIIESRGDAYGKITLITSNLPIQHEQIKAQFGERVYSRLNEMCNYFELLGEDRRK